VPWLCQPVQDQTSLSAIVSQVRGSWPPAHTPINKCYALRSKHARSIWILSCIGHSVHSWVSVIEYKFHTEVFVFAKSVLRSENDESRIPLSLCLMVVVLKLMPVTWTKLMPVTWTRLACNAQIQKGKEMGTQKSRKEMQVQGGRWVWWRVCKVLGTSCCCKRVHFWKTMNTVAFTWPILPAEICY
jgi:hypothetical protein